MPTLITFGDNQSLSVDEEPEAVSKKLSEAARDQTLANFKETFGSARVDVNPAQVLFLRYEAKRP